MENAVFCLTLALQIVTLSCYRRWIGWKSLSQYPKLNSAETQALLGYPHAAPCWPRMTASASRQVRNKQHPAPHRPTPLSCHFHLITVLVQNLGLCLILLHVLNLVLPANKCFYIPSSLCLYVRD